MTSKKRFMRLPLLFMGLFLVFAISCDKEDNNDIDDGDNTEHEYGEMTDSRDGKTYKTIQIGNQEWMAENLAYAPSSGNYWAYDNDDANVEVYGYLYDWETACDVCPDGWHLPSNDEWAELTDYLGGEEVAGGKLKETGTTHWKSPNTGATNETGFTALPGGSRSYNSNFRDVGHCGTWWSASAYDADVAGTRYMRYNYSSLRMFNDLNYLGFSVRCLRD